MKKRKILWGAVGCLMALTMVMAACTPKPTPPPTTPPTAPQTGVAEVRVIDAPAKGVSKIMVTTSNIEVHKAGASEESWVSLVKEAKTFDLVTIQGVEMLLGQKELEAGQYTQIRLDVTSVKVVLEGKELTAKLPGEKLKVVGNWEVKAGQKTILTIDFDADKFVVITGNDQAQVKPVIKLLVSQGERPLTKPAPDTTPPTVSLTINANGATNVAVNTKTGAFFSERMDPSTINTTTFTLKQGTTPVTGAVTYAGVAALFTPAANMAANTEYTATITTGAKDLAGNALASPYIWKWTTVAAPDTTAPMVSSTTNANGATDVPINTKVSAFFSDVMDPLTVTNTTFTLKQGNTPVNGTVDYAGLTATFTPDVYLAASTVYTATITTGAKDLAGNALTGDKVWTFTTSVAADTTAPTVSSTIPPNVDTGVPVNSAMSSTFSEAMDPLTVTTATFTLMRGNALVAGVVAYTGVTATFTPAETLATYTVYTATITTGAKDLAGNALAANKVWTFTTTSGSGGGGGGGGGGDTTAPTVSSTIPANAATGVAINSAMSAVFSEAMIAGTVTTVTFTLTQGVAPVAGAVTYAGVTATFTPAATLTASTAYTATITTVVTDLAGNHLAANKVWTFTTGAAPDTTAPTVSSTIPTNAATGVAINSAMSAVFSEAMIAGTVTTVTFTLTQGVTPVAGAVTYAGVTATFTPTANLAFSTEYTATITTVVTDLAGNHLAVDKVWTFTTGAAPDTTAPTVSSTIPANAATGVAINSAMSAVFSEAMIAGTVTTATFTLKHGVTPDDGAVTYAGVTATFTPTANLAFSTEYTATITTVVTDLAGNHLAIDKVWTFTTGAAPDTTAPTVSSTIPANAATGVAINSAMSAVFSEAMIAGTVTNVTFTLKHGVTPDDGAVTYAGVTATFTPTANLAFSTEYTATITTVVTDLAGNHLAVDKVWTFTTGAAPDTTAPTVSSTIPANAATGVAVSSNISAVFSEAMIAGTVTNVTFTLTQGATPVAGAVDYAGVTATFNPDVDLAASSNYTATITTVVTDLAGNHLAANKVWTFGTAAALVANPTAPIASSGLAAGTVLGEAAGFVIIGHAAITANPPTATSVSNGDMGLIGHARSVYAGFTQTLNPRQFTELTNGLFYANDDDGLGMPLPDGYASATAFLVQVQTDLGEAYTFLQGVNPTFPVPIDLSPNTELGLRTLTRGVYNTGASVTISTGDLHLDAEGDPDSVWIFQIGTDLTTTAPGLKIWLDNGAKAENVYWVTGGLTSIGSGMEFNGNVFAGSNIAVGDGAPILGRLFAMTEGVTTISNSITGFNPIP